MSNIARGRELTPHGLLERDADLARTVDLLADARAGRGRLLVIEGPAGIGKTALLQAIRQQGADAGFEVVRAAGIQLEREFPHGVVRQLFEAQLHARSADERASLLSGAAGLAGPIVLPETAVSPTPHAVDPAFVAHGLYWLTANLADRRPLLLLVDDVHWADVPSLRFLLHLAQRMDGLSALLVGTVRTGEPATDDDLLTELVSHPDAERLRPSPLSETGVGHVIAAAMGRDFDPRFASACRHATGGIPFLLTELVAALADRGIHPGRESVPEVSKIGPETVARATLLRLGRLMPGAAELARAVAVLGGDGRLDRAARLAGIDQDRAVELADSLVSANILHPGLPLEFTHPIVRSAIYDDIPPPSRVAAHSRAADVLVGERADIDAIAGHLLLTDPAARPESAERLRAAAERALAQGAPDSAATYLRRALQEGGLGTEQRAVLLHELGRAERPLRPGAAIEYLEKSWALATDPDRRAQIVYELGDALFWVGQWKQAVDLVESAIGEFTDRDPDLVLRLEAMRAGQASVDARSIFDFFQEDFRRLRKLASAGTPGGRLLAIVLAHATAWLIQPPEMTERLLGLALDGRPVLEHAPESWIVQFLLFAVVLTEDLDRALAIGDALAAEARRRGSRNGFAYCLGARAWIHARRGALAATEADVRIALDGVRSWSVPFGIHTFSWCGLDAMLERPALADEADKLETLPPEGTLEATPAWTAALEARGRMRLVRGDIQGGVEDLTRCGETVFANANPNGWGWQPALALALAPTEPEHALALATSYLDAARVVGLPRAIGIGLRTLGLVRGTTLGLSDLEQAVSVLEGSPARLEHARALVELGAARRRANQRAAAREPLRLGLDLAHRCGATRLEQRARAELTATGGRPRRAMLSGRDALTASEQRIAQMAAEGMSNPEIAQALFVTRRTVENHLARTYAKLGIHSREELHAALADSDS